ncbi:hypothetical protein [Haloprofundus salilacus]|uniref:hypothetical protein n=1 Tax=Haloprofundus salilacus TaxID=2876190 RepID=UPI001CCB9670|nr:hypothetical protein [Haloprofundus salilacus]
MNHEELESALRREFDGTDAEFRVVVRQAGDLADVGRVETDRGVPLTVDAIVDDLSDAPDGRVASRWNWWLGALEAAYGGYEPYQVRWIPKE